MSQKVLFFKNLQKDFKINSFEAGDAKMLK